MPNVWYDGIYTGIHMLGETFHSKEIILACGISIDCFHLQNNRLKCIRLNIDVKYQWWCYWHLTCKIRVISMILYLLELIFSVVLFNGFSCQEKSLCNHSYQSSDSSSMVDECSQIIHYHCIRFRKVKMDKVNFSLLFWVSFLTFCIDCVVHQSKISLYPGWTHLNNCSLLGLYWTLVQLWLWDLPNFQNRVPNAMEISQWEMDPEVCSSLCVQFFGSSRGRDHRDLALLKCNLLSNWNMCHKNGVDPSIE